VVNGIAGLAAAYSRVELESLMNAGNGKSINPIRQIAGRGWLVWGARTLAGHDNEWLYVPVRRLCSQLEASIRQSTGRFVFEPNDAGTWLRVRRMIEDYLLQKWQVGALQGARPEQAFFVRCGLGQTMTAQDIGAGRMIVEFGLAAVRPAEFIVLRCAFEMQSG
jgi:phage tail sheath protein FI